MNLSDAELMETYMQICRKSKHAGVPINQCNVVGHVRMAGKNPAISSNIDLFELVREMAFATYKKRTFAGLIIKFVDPKATLLVFDKKSVVCVGSRSPDQFRLALQLMRILMNSLGHKGEMEDISYDNVVAGTHIGYRLNLQKLHEMDKSNTSYEPEKFPGIVLNTRLEDRITCLGFETGNLVIMGATSMGQIESELELLRPLLEACKEEGGNQKAKTSYKRARNSNEPTAKDIKDIGKLAMRCKEKRGLENELVRFSVCKNRINEFEKTTAGQANKELIDIFRKAIQGKKLGKEICEKVGGDIDEKELSTVIRDSLYDAKSNLLGWINILKLNKKAKRQRKAAP